MWEIGGAQLPRGGGIPLVVCRCANARSHELRVERISKRQKIYHVKTFVLSNNASHPTTPLQKGSHQTTPSRSRAPPLSAHTSAAYHRSSCCEPESSSCTCGPTPEAQAAVADPSSFQAPRGSTSSSDARGTAQCHPSGD